MYIGGEFGDGKNFGNPGQKRDDGDRKTRRLIFCGLPLRLAERRFT